LFPVDDALTVSEVEEEVLVELDEDDVVEVVLDEVDVVVVVDDWVVVVVEVVLVEVWEVEELVVTLGAAFTPNAVPRKACDEDSVALTAKLLPEAENCSHSPNTVGVMEWGNAVNPLSGVVAGLDAMSNNPNTSSLELAVLTGLTCADVVPDDEELAGLIAGSKGFAGS
jgi:hypothetical protein